MFPSVAARNAFRLENEVDLKAADPRERSRVLARQIPTLQRVQRVGCQFVLSKTRVSSDVYKMLLLLMVPLHLCESLFLKAWLLTTTGSDL